MITFQNVSKVYNHNSIALENVSFKILPNEFASIVGRSGAGKSTVIKLLIGEERPSKGRIFFGDVEVTRVAYGNMPSLRRKIGVIFQDFRLLAAKTAFENIAFALEAAGRPQWEITQFVPQLLDMVGIKDRANNFPHELSGGEKQRVAIARALINRPDVIVADEPTGNLDPINTWDIIKLLLKINELGTTVILATHDKEIINSLGKRVISLDRGRMIRDEQEGRFILS
ncbi:MAG: cell division ATP-binding protein FtsE [Parcubacteria group bacterium RIFCSPLOWO2_01_FULL_48_18]|nr:MAG: cell division ATP-binding protein FtsE [Parcubacteria group bacterium RIFCSPHIGHO2_02_FULL_48_10b]OHB21817.1 MAG: cell division ATP-binding protein FtsE [Parcubacteria group bacterium RIFCSPLOWO2_01_FULL_48_18]